MASYTVTTVFARVTRGRENEGQNRTSSSTAGPSRRFSQNSIRIAGPDDAEALAPLFTTFNEQVGIMGLPAGADKGEAALVTVAQMRRRLQALAGQADLTRVWTFMYAREATSINFPSSAARRKSLVIFCTPR